MATGDITWKINGYDLDTALGAFLTDVSVWRAPVAVRRSPITIPGVHGTIRAGLPVYDEPQVTIAPKWRAANQVDLEELVNHAQALLSQPTLTLTRVSGGVETSAAAELVSITPGEFLVGDTATCTILLAVPGVFFRGDLITTDPAAFDTDLVDVELDPQLSVSSGPIIDAIFRITGPASSVNLTDPLTGTGLSWAGTLTAGQYLYLSAKPLDARISSSSSAWMSGGTSELANLTWPAAGPLQLTPVVQTATTRQVLLSAAGGGRTIGVTKLTVRAKASYL